MRQTAQEQLETPLFANSMSTHFLFCLGGQDLAKEEMKLAKNGNRTQNYICEDRTYEHERAGETPRAIS